MIQQHPQVRPIIHSMTAFVLQQQPEAETYSAVTSFFIINHARSHIPLRAAPTDWFLADKMGNTGRAVSIGLMKSGQNHS